MDVKALREKLNMTQQELADDIGVTVRTIQNWEDGRKVPAAMLKLLKNIEETHAIISSYKHDKSVNVESGNGNTIQINADTERIFAHPDMMIDELIEQLPQFPPSKLATLLLQLELNGVILCNPGKCYRIN